MTDLPVPFRDFADAPKNEAHFVSNSFCSMVYAFRDNFRKDFWSCTHKNLKRFETLAYPSFVFRLKCVAMRSITFLS